MARAELECMRVNKENARASHERSKSQDGAIIKSLQGQLKELHQAKADLRSVEVENKSLKKEITSTVGYAAELNWQLETLKHESSAPTEPPRTICLPGRSARHNMTIPNQAAVSSSAHNVLHMA
ncbi:hypothetical protein K491DRAFT_722074 [Lophiostoma macrostomum CBS 122681]|uniref:Uncharacterized protein n=1 Tax=Lophiostoma macrostomum CBS 122681 TaxID=1314788 RepID=A0A6A6SMZ4_9PLEO|nr:hypothetical protein K491DRAFT_722074 [Lophiostoma macrostomum CBS 122681]